MPAQDRSEGSGRASQSAPKRQSRQPTKFMFIDSSNGGVNAKPDRVVRSFVMKSARNKKPWSTRPKSPKDEDCIEADPQGRPLCQNKTTYEHTFAVGTSSPHDYRKDSLWDRQSLTSPASSRSRSIISTCSSTRTCDSPASSYTSPLAEKSCPEHVYNISLAQETGLMLHNGFQSESFGCLSVNMDVYNQRLLHQFVEGSAPRLIPVDLHKTSCSAATNWIAKCIQSPNGAPYIYAALTASARAAGLDSETYKWRAVSEVNKLLSNPKTSTDDTTIAAVLILLALEESDLADPRRQGRDRDSSLSANDAHLNGLRTMIWQRGGLASLNENRCLQVFILMHSIAQCITTLKRPYALLLNPMGQIESYALITQHSRSQTVPAFVHNIKLDPTLLDTMNSIHLLNSDLADWYDTGYVIPPLDSFELQKHACLLMYRLFDWYQLSLHFEPTGRFERNPLDQSLCLAYLIYLVIATEPQAQSFGMRLSKLVTQLRQTLQRVAISHWANAPDLFLWTLTMGAMGAKDLPQSQRSSASTFAFFVQYAQLSFLSSGQRNPITADHLLRKMQHCAWIPSVFDMRARRLWAQMGLCNVDVLDMSDSSSDEDDVVVNDEFAVGQSTTARFFPTLLSGSKKSSPRLNLT